MRVRKESERERERVKDKCLVELDSDSWLCIQTKYLIKYIGGSLKGVEGFLRTFISLYSKSIKQICYGLCERGELVE